MQQWLLTNWWIILSIMSAMSIAYYRINEMEKKQDKHLDPSNSSPHPACPVHSEKFGELFKTLMNIDKRLETLDERIYDFMRSNGYKDRKISQD
jgi:hypothetical protein